MKLQKFEKNERSGYWLTVPKELAETRGYQRGDIFFAVPVEDGIKFVYGGRKQ